MTTTSKVEGQTAIDEEQIDDEALESTLDLRLVKLVAKREAAKAYKAINKTVTELLAGYDIPEDGALRVGRHRIVKKRTPSRHVEFDSEEKEHFEIDSGSGE